MQEDFVDANMRGSFYMLCLFWLPILLDGLTKLFCRSEKAGRITSKILTLMTDMCLDICTVLT